MVLLYIYSILKNATFHFFIERVYDSIRMQFDSSSCDDAYNTGCSSNADFVGSVI